MSSPIRKTDLSASISSQRPREMASRNVISGIASPPRSEWHDGIVRKNALPCVGPVRQRRFFRKRDGVVNRLRDFLPDVVSFGVGEFDRLFAAVDRVFLFPLFDQLFRDVRLIVVR